MNEKLQRDIKTGIQKKGEHPNSFGRIEIETYPPPEKNREPFRERRKIRIQVIPTASQNQTRMIST